MADATVPGRAAFGYRCNRCGECCRRYRIQVNPYEVIRLAIRAGTSTGDVIERRVVRDGPWLQRDAQGACTFLGESGCSVHGDRPLVCRVYPLGARFAPDGSVRFAQLELPERSAGDFTGSGTVDEYVTAQGWAPYANAYRRCDALRVRLIRAHTDGRAITVPDGFGDDALDWLDADRVIRLAGESPDAACAEARFEQYARIVEHWLGGAADPAPQDPARA